MELTAVNIVLTYGGGENCSVFAFSYGFFGNLSEIGMNEINIGLVGNVAEQGAFFPDVQQIPSDLRNFMLLIVRKPAARTGKKAEPFAGAALFALLKKKLEAQADEQGMEAMLSLLRTIDPESAAKLHLADRKRILRALEVYYETGETITRHNEKTQALPPRFEALWFALEDRDRSALYARIDRRVEAMLEAGLIEEIHKLLAMGIPKKCTAMQAIGYKEFLDALDGSCTMAQAVEKVQQSSRHYAKRQLTWFRRNPNIHWLRREAGEGTGEILSKALRIVREFDIS